MSARLGTSVHSEDGGRVLMRTNDELSICEKAARPGCIVTELDGKSVGAGYNFSRPRGARCSRYVDKSLSPSYRLEDRTTQLTCPTLTPPPPLRAPPLSQRPSPPSMSPS